MQCQDRINQLEQAIIERDELIYTMMKTMSHYYINFVTDKRSGIEPLKKFMHVAKFIDDRIAKNRIKLLHKDLNINK